MILRRLPGFFDTHRPARAGHELQVCLRCGDVLEVSLRLQRRKQIVIVPHFWRSTYPEAAGDE